MNVVNVIYDEETQIKKATWWVERRNATLISTSKDGFVYMLSNGETYSISWFEALL